MTDTGYLHRRQTDIRWHSLRQSVALRRFHCRHHHIRKSPPAELRPVILCGGLFLARHCRRWDRRVLSPHGGATRQTRESQVHGDSNHEPMEIGTIRRPLTKEEKDQRRKNGQCLYGGRKGHFTKECPAKPKSKQTPTKKVVANAQIKQEN
ncbi:hypothetical protein NDU88_002410 [Pleurodeles waltl]|uniref:CCHC-type domain-containing protein n=1 Tax=Pleurodeles waltl TaxID=8319 RepID=A0AAV7MRK0_PLEWA|nr:hypothetical protein NDU88_002410 [Pleurodeles waltl]